MTPRRGPSGYLRALLLAALAIFAACLNPQPDDNPLVTPAGETPVTQGTPGATATDPSPVFDDDDDVKSPEPTPPASRPGDEATPTSGSSDADAGAPPPLDDAGTRRQGDLVEADAGD